MMRRPKALLSLLAIYITFLQPAQAETVKAETITIVADEWCPYNCEPGSEKPGFMIEIAQKAFAKHNIAVEYINIPWTRSLAAVRKGKYNAVTSATENEVPNLVIPLVEQGYARDAFYVKSGNPWRYKNVKSLENITLGIIADYNYGEDLDAYISKHKDNLEKIQSLSSDDALDLNIKKLLSGRIDAFVEAEYVAGYTMAKQGNSDKIDYAGPIPTSSNNNLYVAFSPAIKESAGYAEILTKEMKAMRASGELAAILGRYAVDDWK
jgi:polar amino acid transport system substrate-binding protein